MEDHLGILLAAVVKSMKHSTLENAVAGLSLVQHFE
jgi:hypothetical protein